MEIELRVYLRDAIDILLVSIVMYRILLILKGTRAIQILFGLFWVFALYIASQYFELITLSWVLDHFFTYLVLIIVILFQDEIRTALTRVGTLRLGGRDTLLGADLAEDLLRAVYQMREQGVGALIVLERFDSLGKYIKSGTRLDSTLSRELLIAVFQKDSPLHDGAVIVRDTRVDAAGCFLPIAMDEDLPRNLGTRHRAALGLSRETDAIVIVVSEERKSVSLVYGGVISQNLEQIDLRAELQRAQRETTS